MKFLKLFEKYKIINEKESYDQNNLKNIYLDLKKRFSTNRNGVIIKKVRRPGVLLSNGYKDPESDTLLLFLDKELIGFLDMRWYTDTKKIFVENIYIVANMRRKGFATKLINFFKKEFPEYSLIRSLDYTSLGRKFFKSLIPTPNTK
jgi:hypothetical protein